MPKPDEFVSVIPTHARVRVQFDSEEGRTLPEFNRDRRISLGMTIVWQKMQWAILDITETHVFLGLLAS